MPTDPARVQVVFLVAADLADPHARAEYLDHQCAGDPALRDRVDALLRALDDPDSLLDAPVVPAAGGETRTLPPADPDGTQVEAGRADDLGDARALLGPPTRADAIGRLAHYHILEVLGRGGFGTVFRAFDEKLHRVVAVKVLAPTLAAVGTARQRFLREARSAAAVRDEHVVHIYEVGEQPVPYLVMELVAGQTLQQKLDKAGPLPVPEVLRIGSQVARGLAAAHANGLVHRDVKPANVLLENGVERVKLTDFGLARATDDATLSQSGVVAGTPMYMAPEQARGETVDPRSDLFSLGSVLYAMLTGRPPFRASTTMAVLKRVVEDQPRPIREANPDVADWLEAIVAKLHAKDPADRFGSAREVADLLQQHLAHRQQPAAVPMPAPVVVPPAPRPAGKDAWVQIFEGTDYRGRLRQFAIGVAMFIPVYLFVAAAALGWVDGLRERFGSGVLVGFLVVHILWSVIGLWLLVRVKHRWQVPYKGRTLRLMVSPLGTEGLTVDDAVIARCGWGLSFQELQGSIPDGPGAGDRVRVLGQFGILTPTCRIFASEGSPPTPARSLSAWAKVRRWARPFVWVGAVVLPIAVIIGLSIPKGWVSVKVDDPELVVLLDGDLWVGGADVRPGVVLDIRGRSLGTGEHTVRAVKRGKVVFDETFRLGFNQRREFDLTHQALEKPAGPPPAEPAWVQLYNARDLTGWTQFPAKDPGTWTVIDGRLRGKLPEGQEVSYLVWERGLYENFHLRAEVRVGDGALGGLRFRWHFPDLNPDGGPEAYDAVLNSNSPVKVRTGSLSHLGRDAAVTKRLVEPNVWFTYEVFARGDQIELRVDGATTVKHTDAKRLYRGGRIALEVASPGDVIEFRRVEIKELPAK